MNEQNETLNPKGSEDQVLEPISTTNDGNGNNGAENPPEVPPPTFFDWIQQNNPLYLLSVLCMFGGLLLIQKAGQDGAGVPTVVFFFGVQNVYELIMIVMGLYLFRSHINHRHGSILLLFVLVFLSDITFYQNRIATMCSVQGMVWVSYIVAAIYWILASFKIILAANVLKISLQWEKIFFSLVAFGLVYFAPQYFNNSVNDLNNLEVLRDEVYPQWLLYKIMLVAALIQLPIIVNGWFSSTLEKNTPNSYVRKEQNFYHCILLFPFFLLPFQLGCTIFTSDRLRDIPLLPNFIPYLACSIFFLQAFAKKEIHRHCGTSNYDFFLPSIVLGMAFISHQSSPVAPFSTMIYHINLGLLLTGQAATALTRKNVYSAVLLASIFTWYIAGELLSQGKKAADYAREISYITWGGLMMAASFVLLGIGFIFSLKGNDKKEVSKKLVDRP